MKKHIAILAFLMLFSGISLFAQQAPKAFKYQAVARDANNQPYANTSLRLRIGVVNAANLISYLETHNVTTSDLGVFNLNVGQGTVLSGNFSNVNWGAEALFLSIELSLNDGGTYTSMGLSPLLSVPYALYAGQAAALDGNVADNSPTNELQQLNKVGNVITLSQGGGSVTDEVNDADANPTNEIQTLSISGTVLSLSNGGGSVTLPVGGGGGDNWGNQTVETTIFLNGNGTAFNPLSIADNAINSAKIQNGSIQAADIAPGVIPNYTAGTGISISGNQITNTGDGDNNPANELQTISLSGNNLSLSNGGGTVALPPNTDAQTLALSGNQLSITNGNSVTLQAAPSYTAGTGISISGNQITNIGDADNNPANELQTISLSGNNLSLSNGGGTVALPPNTDAQTLALSGNQLSISNGNSVTLPTGTTYTAGSGINITGNAISATDNSATNELQTISLSGNNLSLSNGGGSVTLPATTGSSYWESAGGNDIINNNGGAVYVSGGPFEAILAATNNSSTTIWSQQSGTGKALVAEGRNSSGYAAEIIGGNGGLHVTANAIGISGINEGPVGGFGVYGESLVPFGIGGVFRNENGVGLEVTGALQVCYLSGNGGYYCPQIRGVTGAVNALEIFADWRPDAINSGIRNLGASNARWNTVFAVNGVINTSDAREKQAIQPLSYGLQQVMAMRPVSYEWSKRPEQGRKIGFLAQELQNVLPEVVADKEWQADENGVLQAKDASVLGVYYADIIPVLTKAIQEQQVQIAGQAAEINALKAALEAQRQDMARILAKLEAGQR